MLITGTMLNLRRQVWPRCRRAGLIPLAIGFSLAGGCIHPTAILVSFDIDLEATKQGPNGIVWAAAREEIIRLPPSPKAADPFNGTIFRGRKFEVKFVAVKSGFVAYLTNLTTFETCFRFDEAKVSSSSRPLALPLRAFRPLDWRIDLPRMKKEDYENRKAAGPQVVEKVCLGAGELRSVPFYLAIEEFFPSGIMFNASHPPHETKLEKDGVGNWLKLLVPIEMNNEIEILEFKMTAVSTRARAAYY
jgi:hypothetical protein